MTKQCSAVQWCWVSVGAPPALTSSAAAVRCAAWCMQGVQEGVPSSRGYRNGFNSSLMVKDLGLASKAAQHCGAPLPMADQAVQLYRWVCG